MEVPDIPKPSDIRSIVPDLYYDLIARVIPGTVFLIEAILTTEPSRSFLIGQDLGKATVSLATVAVLIFLVLAYTAGLLATPLGDLVRRFYTKSIWVSTIDDDSKLKELLKEKFDLRPTPTTNEYEVCYRRMHDYIRTKDHSPRTLVLSKMQAEASLCTNLSTLSLALFCLHIISSVLLRGFGDIKWHSAELLANFAVVVVATYAAIDRSIRLLQRHFVFLRRLESSW